jgi:glucose/arabinose dehydrogenase
MRFIIIMILLAQHLSAQDPSVNVRKIVGGLTAPVAFDAPADGSGRLFVCEQTGKIKIVKNGALLATPFLDIGKLLDKMSKVYSEKGLLGLAFHPQYKTNGRFFVYYSAPPASKQFEHTSVLAEFKVSSNPDAADAASSRTILTIDEPESNHNGGQLAFGPDGMLYIGSGDGGGAGDKHGPKGNAQDLGNLLGKILRVDVSIPGRYTVPADNPFKGRAEAAGEIFAYGLRNPWRFSFDRKTGELFCADVGQNKWEEVDIIRKGRNYGWRVMEGHHCFNPENCSSAGFEMPIAEYGRQEGISVTGGFVYRGPGLPQLQGKYVFADWKGKMFVLTKQNQKAQSQDASKQPAWKLSPLRINGKTGNDLDYEINSFGEDRQGRLYILCQKFTGNFAGNGQLLIIE